MTFCEIVRNLGGLRHSRPLGNPGHVGDLGHLGSPCACGSCDKSDFVLRFWKISGIPESCEVVIFVINMFGHL